MDKLEKYIRENRQNLDLYEPSPEVWQSIRKRSMPGVSFYLKLAAAAAVLVILFISGLTVYNNNTGKRYSAISDESIMKEIRETDYFYNSLLNSLFRQAEPILAENPEIEKELRSDMAAIDKISEELKRDLADNIANQEIIEALIRNYRIKISLLEEMLSTMKAAEQETKMKNGGTDEL